MRQLLTAWLLAMTAVGCGVPEAPATGQVLVWVTTNAPVPETRSESTTIPSLFDRLQIDFYPTEGANDCADDAGCALPASRQIAIDTDLFGREGLSFGVTPPPNVAGYLVRVRLYNAALNNGKMPPALNVIDQIVSLPTVPLEGDPIAMAIVLRVEDLGVEAKVDQPRLPTLGRPPSGLVGTWSGAQRVNCHGAPRAGEVCVPGGAYWMGSMDRIEGPTAPDSPSVRLVQLSPFFMDADEVTVGQFRDAKLAPEPDWSTPLSPGDPQAWNPDPAFPWHYGTWAKDGEPEWPFELPIQNMPVSGVSKPLASAYCQAKGSELPSEAQFEYVSGGLTNRIYIWGNDDPTCSDAVWGRAGVDILTSFWGDCVAPGDTVGPRLPRSGGRDMLKLEGGAIYDIAGNLLEWTRDVWNRQDEPCWNVARQVDPVCERPSSDAATLTVRGGGWPLIAAAMRPAARLGLVDDFASLLVRPAIGFRCVRAD